MIKIILHIFVNEFSKQSKFQSYLKHLPKNWSSLIYFLIIMLVYVLVVYTKTTMWHNSIFTFLSINFLRFLNSIHILLLSHKLEFTYIYFNSMLQFLVVHVSSMWLKSTLTFLSIDEFVKSFEFHLYLIAHPKMLIFYT